MVLMGPAETVELAIERFIAGDDEGFVALFHPDAVIWSDPQLAQGLVLSGRDQIAAWCREARARWSDVKFAHGELSDQGSGAYVELDVVTTTSGGRRMAPLDRCLLSRRARNRGA